MSRAVREFCGTLKPYLDYRDPADVKALARRAAEAAAKAAEEAAAKASAPISNVVQLLQQSQRPKN